MPRDQYIQHVTVTTGHVRRSQRSEVADDILEWCRGHLQRVLAGERDPIPRVQPSCWLTGAAEGRCMTATVWTRDPDAGDTPLVTIAVALHSRCGARLWELIHAHTSLPVETSSQQQAAVPWVAARLEPGIARHPRAAEWLGDYERCLAWAWYERRRAMR